MRRGQITTFQIEQNRAARSTNTVAIDTAIMLWYSVIVQTKSGDTMIIGEEYPNCRYWGYEPVTVGKIHSGMQSREERSALREKLLQERKLIKSRGLRSQVLGLSKRSAMAKAKLIEESTGIEMKVFNHDYL